VMVQQKLQVMSNFIIFQNYKGFKNYENILMSLIVGLDKTKRTICFSNSYAALKCGVTTRTIIRTINNFVEDGYITCQHTNNNSRIIKLIKQPNLLDYVETCDMSENETSVTDNHTSMTQVHTPMTQVHEGGDMVSHNNIEYNIDNNIEASYGDDLIFFAWKNDNRFLNVINQFPENKRIGMKEAYDFTWQFLEEKDKLEIEKTLPMYINRNNKNLNYIKSVKNYFNDKFWITDKITLDLLNKKTKPTRKNIII